MRKVYLEWIFFLSGVVIVYCYIDSLGIDFNKVLKELKKLEDEFQRVLHETLLDFQLATEKDPLAMYHLYLCTFPEPALLYDCMIVPLCLTEEDAAKFFDNVARNQKAMWTLFINFLIYFFKRVKLELFILIINYGKFIENCFYVDPSLIPWFLYNDFNEVNFWRFVFKPVWQFCKNNFDFLLKLFFLVLIFLPFFCFFVLFFSHYFIQEDIERIRVALKIVIYDQKKKLINFLLVFQILCFFFLNIINILYFFSKAIALEIIHIKFSYWMNFGFFWVKWGFLYDNVVAVMLFVILSISFFVQLYSYSYMSQDPNKLKFFSFLSLFAFFMIILVTSDNLVQLFLGWEGVGLSSFLLISFWFTRLQAIKSSLKAMFVNRIGDFFLLLAIVLLYFFFKTCDFLILFPIIFFNTQFFFINFNYVELICFFLFLGAVGKSAQIGLHVWLPDAMEGPTPVSALIHAATMVTAGVFLIVRCSFLFEHSSNIFLVIIFLGSLTAFISASIAIFQNDIKKIIAYSTCSQLGYMMVGCGISCYQLALFHLFTHAFFKALLFLTAGSLLHLLQDEQDIRKLGGLIKLFPLNYILFLIGSLTLIGIPFFSGFYSKDLILENLYAISPISYLFLIITLALTCLYSLRLIYYVFLMTSNIFRAQYLHIYEYLHGNIISYCLISLTILSIFVGFFFSDLFIGYGSLFFRYTIDYKVLHNSIFFSEFFSVLLKNYPFIMIFCSSFLFLGFFFFRIQLFWKMKKIFFIEYRFFIKKWLFDYYYNLLINKPLFTFGLYFIKLFDKGLLECLGPHALNIALRSIFKKIIFFQAKSVFLNFFFSCFLVFIFNLIFVFSIF
jgi:proton-translocating NADH-quinone oxidoreductase chain L